jgi:hypothetical protein
MGLLPKTYPLLCALPDFDAAKTWEGKPTAKVYYGKHCKAHKGTKDACARAKGKYKDGLCEMTNWKAAKTFVCPEDRKPKQSKKQKASFKRCNVATKNLSYRLCAKLKNCPPIGNVPKGTSIELKCWVKGDRAPLTSNKALSGRWGKDKNNPYFYYLAGFGNWCAGGCYPSPFPRCVCGKCRKIS